MDLDAKTFSKYVRISSHDRDFNDTSQTASSFKVNIPSHSREFTALVGCQVVSAHIPNLFYNINEYNNSFTFTTIGDGLPHTIVVPEGQYSSTELVDDLIALIDAELSSSNSYSVADNTFKLTLTFSEDVKFTPSIDTNGLPVILGWGEREIEYTTTASSITSPYPIDLSGVDAVYVHTRELSAGLTDFDISGQDVHPIVSVPLNVSFGQVAYYQSQDSTTGLIRFRNQRAITEINLRLRDSRGRLLDLNGSDMTVVVKIYFRL